MTFFQQANYWEAALWGVIALAFVAASFRKPKSRPRSLRLAFFFAAFGGSDIVEAQYGQWWDPWWLLAWKAVCVIVFLVELIRYAKAQHRRTGAPNDWMRPYSQPLSTGY